MAPEGERQLRGESIGQWAGVEAQNMTIQSQAPTLKATRGMEQLPSSRPIMSRGDAPLH